MIDPIEGEIRDLPIDPQVISQQAQSTIRSVVDAIVELLTNSDDSYRRLEEGDAKASAEIDIHVSREKGGVCRLLQVSDHAEGMDWEGLQKAITFAASASGYFEGRTVRGLFGRGLKEAIVGLGRGEVWTAKEGQESEVEIFVDKKTPKYKVLRKSGSTNQPPGTTVSIEVTSPRITCPKFDIIYRQLSHHFALRDILQNPARVVRLKVEDVDGRRTRVVRFDPLVGRLRAKEELSIEGFGSALIEIHESAEKLEFIRGDPGSVAGVLVKSEAAILDSGLFGFEADEAAHYFYGWLECPGIAAVIRQGDFGVLDPNRSGLDWRHQYCRSLDAEVKRLLRPLIQEKRKQLEGGGPKKVREEYKRKLNDLCRLLNALAEGELEDLPEWGRRGLDVNTLVIRPEVGYAEPNQPRTFSVYVPERLLAELNLASQVEVELVGVKGNIQLLSNGVTLEPHKKYDGLLAGQFALVGASYGDHAYVIARIDRLEDMAELKVQSPGQTRRRRLSGTNRGLFRDIDFDATPEPIQRVSCAEGAIKVFLLFPAMSRYLKAGGEGMESPQGSLMLAELVAEAFCKEVARRRIESVAPPIPGAEIDSFNSQVNQLMRKYLASIHEALVQ